MKKILFVDDDHGMRRTMSMNFRGKNWIDIFEAEDGEGAIRAVKEISPELIFLDVSMPGGLNGFDVLKEIKSNPSTRGIIVAMVTAESNPDEMDKAKAHGADGYFVKPFNPFETYKWGVKKITEIADSDVLPGT